MLNRVGPLSSQENCNTTANIDILYMGGGGVTFEATAHHVSTNCWPLLIVFVTVQRKKIGN